MILGRSLSSRTLLVHLAAGLGLAVAGCSSSDGAALSAPDGEGARVQAYVDSLYAAKDVRRSFRTELGDAIDCVDFATAPGVRRLLASGKTMDEVMKPIQDAQGDGAAKPGLCPKGTYPHLHVTPESISAAGGLDAFLHANRKGPAEHPASAVPADGGLQEDIGYYAWIIDDFSPTQKLSSIQGGTSTMTIASPTLSAVAGDHSVAQVWLQGANNAGSLPRQTIEAGWEATSLGVAGPRPAQLFIGTTPNGYATWCEDDNTSPACPAWVPNPSATLALGQTLPASTPGGTQHELTITIEHQYTLLISCVIRRGCFLTKNYFGWGIWASVDGAQTYLGYYANAGYANDGASGLEVGGDDFQVGGEVFDSNKKWGPPPEVTMGEAPLSAGKATCGRTAVHHDFGYYDSTGALQTGGSIVHETNPSYLYDIATPTCNAAWANYFFYGDAK